MDFPIKYIENNLIKNSSDEWWAYYKIKPYNYSFLGTNQKMQTFYKLRQLVGQIKKGYVHLLVLSVEENMRLAQEHSKSYVIGNLSEIAINTIDRTTEVLIDGTLYEKPDNVEDTPFFIGENQLDYTFYIGFKLIPFDGEGVSIIFKDTLKFWKDYFSSVNHHVMGDFVTVSKEDIERYSRLEDLTYSRISSLLDFQRIEPSELAYIVEHIYGLRNKSYDDYNFNFNIAEFSDYKQIKSYDFIKLSNVMINEYPKHLTYISDDMITYCAYLCYSELVEDLTYPGSEILYYQQSRFDFPVDTSIKLEVVENKRALKQLKNKKKDLRDMDNHAYQSGAESESRVDDANDEADELEALLTDSKDVMFEMSYLLRITADSKQELDRRVNSVRDFYDEYNIKLVCPAGDMLSFHYEFLPSSKIYNVIKRRLPCDFIASLGFGASQDIGEKSGIPVGYVISSLKYFYLQPWLAAQGVKGAVTNSLSMAFIGSLGWGKSFASNLLIYYSVLFGAKAVILDPKSERGLWSERLPKIAHEINIINLTSEKMNKGILDPFVLMSEIKDAENLALDVLTYLMGISIRDSLKYPTLRKAIKAVSKRKERGLLHVIDELRIENTEVSVALAEHLLGFVDTGLAQLLFSDGQNNKSISFNKRLNIIQIADLILPDKTKPVEEYSPTEMLSVAMMIVVSTFCLDFIHSGSDIFKIVDIDEAWSLLNITQGKVLSNKMVREGRSMNAGVAFSTQNAKDLLDETIKNNIGMFFVFHSEDKDEIQNSLKLLGLDYEDENNIKMISTLKKGECLMKDIYGRINAVKFEYLLPELKYAFGTTPKNQHETGR